MSMIFVFGSNLAGIHGKGAARHAVQFHGARYRQGEGPQGTAYALPTKETPYQGLPLRTMAQHVDKFLQYAKNHPELEFQVTRVGCGLAGFSDDDVYPLFAAAPQNCYLPGIWQARRDPGLTRLVVAGSRGFGDRAGLDTELDALVAQLREQAHGRGEPFDLEVVSGACPQGADRLGELWAKDRGYALKRFPANWEMLGKSAGFARNHVMAWYGTHLAAFWDGTSPGTEHMIEAGSNNGLPTHVFRSDAAGDAGLAGINIASNEKGLGAALTNPTELARQKGNLERQYAVVYAGTAWPDAEAAYHALRKEGDAEANDALMVQLLAAKLQQHPYLAKAITSKGGVPFLERCSHLTGARTPQGKSWEGVGRSSRFIRNLIAGYELSLVPGDYSGARQLTLI